MTAVDEEWVHPEGTMNSSVFVHVSAGSVDEPDRRTPEPDPDTRVSSTVRTRSCYLQHVQVSELFWVCSTEVTADGSVVVFTARQLLLSTDEIMNKKLQHTRLCLLHCCCCS